MKYKSLANFFCIMALGFSTDCFAQAPNWRLMQEQGYFLAVGMVRFVSNDGSPLFGVLNFGFRTSGRCAPEIGIAFLKNDDYGNLIRRIDPGNTRTPDLSIDGQVIPSPRPHALMFDNGIEITWRSDEQTVRKFLNGNYMTVRLSPNTGRFQFPLYGAKSVVEQARGRCELARR